MIALIPGGGVSGVGKSLNLDECFGAAFFLPCAKGSSPDACSSLLFYYPTKNVLNGLKKYHVTLR